MSDRDAELKARLMAKAEAAIDGLLATRKRPAEAKLADIEQVVLTTRQQIEQALTAELVAESAGAVTVAWPSCPKCGRRLKVKGQRRRTVVLETGEVTVARTYYHCTTCKTGVFPPG